MNKPPMRSARPLSAFLKSSLGDSFARQGFASTELVTRWADIVGPEVGEHSQPVRIKWPREDADSDGSAVLVLRVEGPAALEIQHLSGVILERVNRFFGWQAVGRLALRQAPLTRRHRPVPPAIDADAMAREAATLGAVRSDDLRRALARLGAAIKRT